MAEKLGKPAVSIVIRSFEKLARAEALKKGMPHQRFVFFPQVLYKKTAAQIRTYIEANDSITGVPIMQEIVTALTKPLTDLEKKAGFFEPAGGSRLVGPDTPDN